MSLDKAAVHLVQSRNQCVDVRSIITKPKEECVGSWIQKYSKEGHPTLDRSW